MATLQELVTKYTLDDSGYKSGGERVLHVTDETAQSIERLGMTIRGNLHSSFTGILGPISGFIGGAGLLGAVKYSLNAAMSFDTMTRSLTAVTGSAQRAKEVLSFVDKLAIPSIFTSAQLGEASTTLEAFQLKTERFLPIAEKLATVFGGKAEDLRQFVDALGMIKGQRFGEGFESLARAGISRDALKLRGLTFDKGGEFKGNVDEALRAVEEEVNARFGTLSKEMADGPGAKMASVFDALGRAARTAGNEGLSVFVPVAEKAGDAIQKVVDNGTVRAAAASIASIFNADAISSRIPKIIDLVVDGAQKLPDLFDRTEGTLVRIERVGRQLIGSFSRDFVPTLEITLATTNRLLDVFLRIPRPIQDAVVALGLINRMSGGIAGQLGGVLVGGIARGLSKSPAAGPAAAAGEGGAGLWPFLMLPLGQAIPTVKAWLGGLARSISDLRSQAAIDGLTGIRGAITLLGQASITGAASLGILGAAVIGFGLIVGKKVYEFKDAVENGQRAADRNADRPFTAGDYIRNRREAGDRRDFWTLVDEFNRKYPKLARPDARNRKAEEEQQAQAKAGGATEQLSLLKQIEDHTRATAESTRDFGVHALGGGNLGRIGATMAELKTLRRNPTAYIDLGPRMNKVHDAIAEVIYEAIHSLQRQGAFG